MTGRRVVVSGLLTGVRVADDVDVVAANPDVRIDVLTVGGRPIRHVQGSSPAGAYPVAIEPGIEAQDE